MAKIPDWVCPRTLRWAADGVAAEHEQAEFFIEDKRLMILHGKNISDKQRHSIDISRSRLIRVNEYRKTLMRRYRWWATYAENRNA